ncbi:hypothetical protein [Thiothrix nivea]|uniref:Uncharacterized protein n=1 Tax=Thiothrix nivea (strain ATCC 35100 / DSM 5205 / JP2) TaxID=870187 RepID=A0A656HIL4_THINJ|nr:hypothetical protein [Thiothrix nivea]EIJ36297.1 hypothetical protein Thini_3795 [Thiothrix nivea DSM 5205]
MLTICRVVLGICLLASVQPVFAKEAIDSEQTTGISFSIKTQQQDLTLNSLSLESAPPQLASLANMADQIKASSDTQTTSIQLSRRIAPGINVFGSIGQVSGETIAKIPALPRIQLPDIKIDTDGMIYSVGARAVVKKEQYLASLTYVHTLYKPDNTLNAASHSYSITPSVGVITDAGVFSLGLTYQENKRDFTGKLNTPLGEAAVKANVENKHKTSWVAAYRTELGNDLYLRGGVELGGKEGVSLAIIKRF